MRAENASTFVVGSSKKSVPTSCRIDLLSWYSSVYEGTVSLIEYKYYDDRCCQGVLGLQLVFDSFFLLFCVLIPSAVTVADRKKDTTRERLFKSFLNLPPY